ncbi:H-2 class I histocompatibility antigen, Q9 alpha chain-like [Talpa occidentalis]|uniref:H-2 class I histocompatibility antigen, Q9 alpha chain-like n=1 Tax=Talpa occidentalis TaxID=50954 RepID=UPI0023F71A42|nr:H-2 class I histocompatibility antigen, Q9 alpha chain-like [Talpa occidentalis]
MLFPPNRGLRPISLGPGPALRGVSPGLPSPPPGPHSLRLFYTVMSQPGLGEPRFISVGYVDDTQFGRFDSDSPGQSAEPRAPWAGQVGQEDLDEETLIQRDNAQWFKALLRDLRGRYNQSEDGSHTLQRMCGCEVGPHGSLLGGCNQFVYEDADSISLSEDLRSWTPAGSGAQITQRAWEAAGRAERVRHSVQSRCFPWLRRLLEMGKEVHPPKTYVTLHLTSDCEITLNAPLLAGSQPCHTGWDDIGAIEE